MMRFFFFKASRLKIKKNVGFGLYSTPMASFLFYIPFTGKERLPKTPATAVLVCTESDSEQCSSLLDLCKIKLLHPRSVSLRHR